VSSSSGEASCITAIRVYVTFINDYRDMVIATVASHGLERSSSTHKLQRHTKQTMSLTVVTSVYGGLSRFHSADKDAVDR